VELDEEVKKIPWYDSLSRLIVSSDEDEENVK